MAKEKLVTRIGKGPGHQTVVELTPSGRTAAESELAERAKEFTLLDMLVDDATKRRQVIEIAEFLTKEATPHIE